MTRPLALALLLACAPPRPPEPESASEFTAGVVASLDYRCPSQQGDRLIVTYQGGAVEIEHGCRPLEDLGTKPKIGRRP